MAKSGAAGFFTNADAVPCEQDKLNVQFCVAVTVAPASGIVLKLITAVSNCGPLLAIIVAPVGNTQEMGVVVTLDVATNLTGVFGHAIADTGAMVTMGRGATTINSDTGELQ